MEATRILTQRPLKLLAHNLGKEVGVNYGASVIASGSSQQREGQSRNRPNSAFDIGVPLLSRFSGQGTVRATPSDRQDASGALNAVYRHSRLENVENVYQGASSLSGSNKDNTADEPPDLDAMSQLYLERGTWNNEAAQVEVSHTVHAPHGGTKTWRNSAQGENSGSWAHAEQNASPPLASVGVSASRTEVIADQESFERFARFSHVEDAAFTPGGNFEREHFLGSDAGGPLPFGSLGTPKSVNRTRIAAAKPWHETIERFDEADGDFDNRLQPESNKEAAPHLRDGERARWRSSREDGVSAQKVRGEPLLKERHYRSTPTSSTLREETVPRPRKVFQAGSGRSREAAVRESAFVPQDDSWGRPAEAQEQSRVNGARPRLPENEDAQRTEGTGVESVQGLVFGRAGLLGLVGSAIRWMQRLARALAAVVARNLPGSVPQWSVEAVLSGVVALVGVWLCKAVLEVVLALGTVLCCAFIAACVYWTATQRAAPDAGESRREPFSSQEEANWLGANDGQKGRAGRHQKKHHGMRSDGARAYRQSPVFARREFRDQSSQSGRRKGGLWNRYKDA